MKRSMILRINFVGDYSASRGKCLFVNYCGAIEIVTTDNFTKTPIGYRYIQFNDSSLVI